jgi:hypothetical protein
VYFATHPAPAIAAGTVTLAVTVMLSLAEPRSIISWLVIMLAVVLPVGHVTVWVPEEVIHSPLLPTNAPTPPTAPELPLVLAEPTSVPPLEPPLDELPPEPPDPLPEEEDVASAAPLSAPSTLRFELVQLAR